MSQESTLIERERKKNREREKKNNQKLREVI